MSLNVSDLKGSKQEIETLAREAYELAIQEPWLRPEA